ncbi:hypothetical protein BN1708_009551, partial [Verticillium longisporum]
ASTLPPPPPPPPPLGEPFKTTSTVHRLLLLDVFCSTNDVFQSSAHSKKQHSLPFHPKTNLVAKHRPHPLLSPSFAPPPGIAILLDSPTTRHPYDPSLPSSFPPWPKPLNLLSRSPTPRRSANAVLVDSASLGSEDQLPLKGTACLVWGLEVRKRYRHRPLPYPPRPSALRGWSNLACRQKFRAGSLPLPGLVNNPPGLYFLPVSADLPRRT